MRMRYGLYVITCEDPSRGRGHLEVAEAALKGGATTIQLRDKHMPAKELYRLAEEMKLLVKSCALGSIFIINDRVDVAAAVGADGVHLGQEDLPLEAARKILGKTAIIGVSAANVKEAVEAERGGANYLGVGPVFPTPSKDDAGEPIGLGGLEEIRRAVSIPLIAIGGINQDNLEAVLKAGADGAAVISAVAGAEDMVVAAQRLAQMIDLHLRGGE